MGFLIWGLLVQACGLGADADGSDHKYKQGDRFPLYANKVGPFHNSRGAMLFWSKVMEHPKSSLVKQVANATNDVAGDGTTCSTMLTRAILGEGCKSVAARMNARDLRHGITIVVDVVMANLKSRARMISTSEEIAQVATISANGEREIGELTAKAMEKVGKEGVITISTRS